MQLSQVTGWESGEVVVGSGAKDSLCEWSLEGLIDPVDL